MSDEDVRELERAAERASPEVVRWLRALSRAGREPKVPAPETAGGPRERAPSNAPTWVHDRAATLRHHGLTP